MFKICMFSVFILLLPITNIVNSAENNDTDLSLTNLLGKPGQYEVNHKLAADDLQNVLASRYPSLFNGRSEVEFISPFIRKAFNFKGFKTFQEHNFIVKKTEPLFFILKSQISNMIQIHPQLQFLVDEIDHCIKTKDFDLIKLSGYAFRVLGSISQEPSRESLSIFKDYNGQKIDSILRKNWQNYSSFYYLEQYSNIPCAVIPYLDISDSYKEELHNKSEEALHFPFKYPIFEKGKFGLVTLITSFINQIYPISVTSKTQSGHGILLSPLLFGYHDFIHSELHETYRVSLFKGAMHKLFQDVTKNKIDGDQLIEPVVQYMVAKSDLIDDTLKTLVGMYFTHYLPHYSIQEIKKIMVGFFHLIHESALGTMEIFREDDLEKILKNLFGENSFQSNTKSQNILNSRGNLLKSDPLTGKTNLSPEEALKILIENDRLPKQQEIYPSQKGKFKMGDLSGKKYKVDMQQEPMVTTVILKVASGQIYSWEETTLKYQLAESLDIIALLKIAGINMLPLTIEELLQNNSEQLALNYLNKIDSNLNDCENFFRITASKLIHQRLSNSNYTLSEKFKRKSQKIEGGLLVNSYKVN